MLISRPQPCGPSQLSEIGITPLMFNAALDFSLKKLLAVRRIAVLGMVVQMNLATHAGHGPGLLIALSCASTVVLLNVSFALGAFFAGMVLCEFESESSHRGAHELLPLCDAFSVLLFVSVSMLLKPAVLMQEPLRVLIVVAALRCLLNTALRVAATSDTFDIRRMADAARTLNLLIEIVLRAGTVFMGDGKLASSMARHVLLRFEPSLSKNKIPTKSSLCASSASADCYLIDTASGGWQGHGYGHPLHPGDCQHALVQVVYKQGQHGLHIGSVVLAPHLPQLLQGSLVAKVHASLVNQQHGNRVILGHQGNQGVIAVFAQRHMQFVGSVHQHIGAQRDAHCRAVQQSLLQGGTQGFLAHGAASLPVN